MPPMASIRDPNLLQSTSEIATQPVKINNRPMQHTTLGKPLSRILSKAPLISALPQHPFEKLVLKILNGVKLKAGEGILGRSDPYITLKPGSTEFRTKPDINGGKNPVSPSFSFFYPHANPSKMR